MVNHHLRSALTHTHTHMPDSGSSSHASSAAPSAAIFIDRVKFLEDNFLGFEDKLDGLVKLFTPASSLQLPQPLDRRILRQPPTKNSVSHFLIKGPARRALCSSRCQLRQCLSPKTSLSPRIWTLASLRQNGKAQFLREAQEPSSLSF